KAYMHITRAELGAAIAEAHKRGLKVTGHLCSVTYREAAALGIDNLEHGFFVSTDFVRDKKPDVCPGQNTGLAAIAEAHKRGLKVTGHLCSVTYREAAALGIDNLEHGFFVSTDFVPDKKPDVCPGQNTGLATIATLTPDSARVRDLIADLVRRHVAITSTLTVFETLVPGRPMPPGLDVLDPILHEEFAQRYAAVQRDTTRRFDAIFAHARALEVAFMRAGGLLIAGTDPTGGGGVIPGYSNQRELELLVESGLTPLEAIKVGTLNGALYLGREKQVGSIAVGKQADLVVINGDPSKNIADIAHVELVFRQGIGYDPEKLIASVRGKVGLF
ncbi:MAG TPA: amidohydrolase family protein, partial [Acidimicrobiia bacterium]|nr:amidohydrolase family protein [Acidimicrobiia bacterium]